MKIGDEVYIHGYVDEIRKDTVIVRNEGGYFGTVKDEIKQKPKIGHWECVELFYDCESRGAIITCSECGNEFKVSPEVFENLYDNEKFCNHCGCRMSEVSG